MVGDEAVFAMSGAQLRLKARGHWPGHSSCSYQTLASFLKIPPPLGDVIIRYANDRLIISTLQVTARWVAKSATPVADEDVPAPYPYSRACLSRGRKTTGLRADQRRLERVSESRGNNPMRTPSTNSTAFRRCRESRRLPVASASTGGWSFSRQSRCRRINQSEPDSVGWHLLHQLH